MVVSLVQENVLKATGGTRMEILFIDQDQQSFGRIIREQLDGRDGLTLVTSLGGQALDTDQARALVDRGQYQVCIVVPAGSPQVQMDPGWGSRRLMDVVAEQSCLKKLPTSVQQNVAAWSVFGIFFIVLPLGGAIIRERRDGTLARLKTLPIPYMTILAGKLAAYVTVCWVQFLFIALVGKAGLPLLGLPVLGLGTDSIALMVTVTTVALAACGYGLAIGTLARTYDQAIMFGAVSVVCAAALGGIMVPVYVMPPVMQTISKFSPLAWGLNALVEIAVREGSLGSVRLELLCLAAFSAATMALAWLAWACFGRIDRQAKM